jgi:hypothetical protein
MARLRGSTAAARLLGSTTRLFREGIGLMRLRVLFVCLVLGCLVGVVPGDAVAGEGCENEARRLEQGSVGLPDCRAYELVTPVDKDSGEPHAVVVGLYEAGLEAVKGARASVSGDRMAWDSEYPLPGSATPGLDYLSMRGADGWSSENVMPPQTVAKGLLCPELAGMVAYSSDLSKGILADGFAQTGSFKNENLNCGHDEPRLVPGEPEGFQNLFLRDDDAPSYQLVNVTPPDAPAPVVAPGNNLQYYPAAFLGGSSDLSHVVFEEELPLTAGAPSGDDLYEWVGGAVRLVSFLPDGSQVVGTLAGATRNTEFEEIDEHWVPMNVADARHAVSGDGSRVFFEAGGDLYLREHAEQPQSPLGAHGECTVPVDACTVQVDASEASGPGGGGRFMVASEDGSKVFFTDGDTAGLTSDTVAGSGQNLYEYDLDTGKLVDLTPAGEAGVEGVSGASEDGSYVYFVAEGVLAANAMAGHTAVAGQPNLYVFHAGVTTFVATLAAGSDLCDWTSNMGCLNGQPASPTKGEAPEASGLTARVSANGVFIGFGSVNRLTGYDNTDVNTGQSDNEIFLYDAATGALACASCDPSGAAPTAPGIIRYATRASTNAEVRTAYPQRNVSDAGQVFFETSDALLPRDTNGMRDVYEYEGGGLSLLSSGTSEADSYFLDASVDGSNVFFATAQPLLGRDSDDVYDIYDARVGGGFVEPAGPAPACEGDECRGPGAVAPGLSVPSSVTFAGAGNVPPPIAAKPVVRAKPKPKPVECRRGYAKKRGKCVKRKAAKSSGHSKRGRK